MIGTMIITGVCLAGAGACMEMGAIAADEAARCSKKHRKTGATKMASIKKKIKRR